MLSLAQLREAMGHMGRKVPESELREMVDTLDLKHHGVVEYDEFLAGEPSLGERHRWPSRGRVRAGGRTGRAGEGGAGGPL